MVKPHGVVQITKKLFSIIDKFKDKKILIIGDVMLDKYIWGDVSRISPEAPVQVVNVKKEDNVPGGAANVARNVASLGGSVFIIGLVGDDGPSKTLKSELEKMSIVTDHLITNKKRPTILKMRIVARGQQLLRVDNEEIKEIGKLTTDKIIDNIRKIINKTDIIVISDYGKGLITKDLMERIVMLAEEKKKKIIVDPKPEPLSDEFLKYKGCTLIAPNHLEASIMTNIEEKTEEDLINIGESLMANLGCDVLMTRGEKGISLFKRDGKIEHISTKAKEVFDVTGAGDTLVATLALCLAADSTLEDASIIANHTAGIVVGKVGTSSVKVSELKKSLEEDNA